MSNYSDFVADFPQRCLEVLTLAQGPAIIERREVTLLLMAASAGIVIPYERLRADARIIQPINDRSLHTDAAHQLDGLLADRFLGSRLWSPAAGSRCIGEVQSPAGLPDSWPELKSPPPLDTSVRVRDVLRIIRIGLAHGNILTQADAFGQIAHLIFLCGGFDIKSKKHVTVRFVRVSPSDFLAFLKNWLAELASVDIPGGIVLECSDLAA